jgi:hypothetical protein
MAIECKKNKETVKKLVTQYESKSKPVVKELVDKYTKRSKIKW